MIPVELARAQAEALAVCAAKSPIPTVAAMVKARADEWSSAVRWYEGAEGDGLYPVIVPAALLEQGSKLYWGGCDVDVLRTANGGTGIHVVERGQGARWENRLGGSSPVVMLLSTAQQAMAAFGDGPYPGEPGGPRDPREYV